MRRHKGFTLIELLVVIGIIAVLVGILVPVITGAKTSARKTQCAANLRTIGQAVMSYAADNYRKLPMHAAPSKGTTNLWDISRDTRDALLKAGATRSSFYCPLLDSDTDDNLWDYPIPDPEKAWTVTGYFFLMKRLSVVGPEKDKLTDTAFEFLPKPKDQPSQAFKTKLREALDQPRAGELELAADILMSQVVATGRDFAGLTSNAITPHNRSNHLEAGKKADGSNILFMDGRVEWRNWRPPPTSSATVIPEGQMQIRNIVKGGSRDVEEWY